MNNALTKAVDTAVKRLLVLAAVGHHWHLTTPSYARHMAFGELYGYAHDAADKLSETTQGADADEPCNSKVVVNFVDEGSAVDEIESTRDMIRTLSVTASSEPWLANIAQEIEGSLNAILYKLKRLA